MLTLLSLALLLPALPACVASAASPGLEPAKSETLASKGGLNESLAASKTGEIRVIVNGLRNRKGQVLVSLFASSKGFPGKGDLAARRDARPIDGDQVEVVFEKIAAGAYAVAVLHDEDMDFKMKTGLFGIPKEGYGVSNNAKGRFGPPKYSDAKFNVSGQRVELMISMIYQ